MYTVGVFGQQQSCCENGLDVLDSLSDSVEVAGGLAYWHLLGDDVNCDSSDTS